jgi:GNAT superfamily N-acetyltransferase
VAKTYVATPGEGSRDVVGYYTASAGQIDFQSLPGDFKGLPRYPIPVIRIGKLGVALKNQGKGLGRELLIHALYKAEKLSHELGIFGVTVDAIDESAKRFYTKHGFVTFRDKEMSLFISIQKITEAFT